MLSKCRTKVKRGIRKQVNQLPWVTGERCPEIFGARELTCTPPLEKNTGPFSLPNPSNPLFQSMIHSKENNLTNNKKKKKGKTRRKKGSGWLEYTHFCTLWYVDQTPSSQSLMLWNFLRSQSMRSQLMTNNITGNSLTHMRTREFCSFGLGFLTFTWISTAIIFINTIPRINQSVPTSSHVVTPTAVIISLEK